MHFGGERGGFVVKNGEPGRGAKAVVRWSLTAQAKNQDRAGGFNQKAFAPAARDKCEGRMRLARGLGKRTQEWGWDPPRQAAAGGHGLAMRQVIKREGGVGSGAQGAGAQKTCCAGRRGGTTGVRRAVH